MVFEHHSQVLSASAPLPPPGVGNRGAITLALYYWSSVASDAFLDVMQPLDAYTTFTGHILHKTYIMSITLTNPFGESREGLKKTHIFPKPQTGQSRNLSGEDFQPPGESQQGVPLWTSLLEPRKRWQTYQHRRRSPPGPAPSPASSSPSSDRSL